MRWFRSATLRRSLLPMFGASRRGNGRESIEPIRQAMLEALGEDGAQLNPQLRRRLATLHDPHALWHARAEVVAVLSQLHGEAKAVATVQDLLLVFKGVLPSSLTKTYRAPR
jgi:hypothetical protein